ncbi:hypothetical protein P170DRAFT_453185 [Aspergillus steynii IBT 23096]|uniref:Zn(2)-C6 fungal-type domain-containing protein n=1 Tax=Aspergillus steynii IBT 23096 TaxID=1392250 RepID=A0A2I2GF02_9EURO|nr:uncharacterized protein P170DRAFT_453185 [Aspergillus steynii IBT 23096]PLB51464.1 hypothetical protein P170DRAFT_453185 [Aspergillus steynii IBT 23096]
MIAPSRGRKSRKHSKTFTGCWTCRARKVKCDERKPTCLQCMIKRLDCAGYGVRLHWLPPEHGASKYHRDPPDLSRCRPQRSQIPFELRHCGLAEEDLDRSLDIIDELATAWDRSVPSNRDTLLVDGFGVFEATIPVYNSSSSLEACSNGTFPSNPTFNFDSSPPRQHLESISDTSHAEPTFSFSPVVLDNVTPFLLPEDDQATIHDLLNPVQASDPHSNDHTCHPTFYDPEESDLQQSDVLRADKQHLTWVEPGGSIIRSPTPSYLSPLEQFLMHHYMHRAVRLFCIIENKKSPWQKIHLKRALQSTGQMSVEGSTSPIQDALRNALLSISAFVLSNDNTSRERDDEAVRWVSEAMVLRGKTIKLLKDSVERGFGCSSQIKYKDYLATMLSMISINVMSGDTSTCGVHLDGALHFMKMARTWKARYSAKARSLHRTYIYLRTMYESTALRQREEKSQTTSHLVIPELRHFSTVDEQCSSEQDPTEQCLDLDPQSRMSTYECIYGVPQVLLIFLHRATNLVISVTKAREDSGNIMIPDELSEQCDELENAIMDWPLDSELAKRSIDDSSCSSEIIRKTARAFHNAVIIYFAQHIRLVGHRYLHSYIQTVLECIESIEKIKADSHCLAAPLYWPAFIAASEAFDERLQERFKEWYAQVEVYGIAAVRTGISVLTQVWKNGAVMGNRITSRWHMEVKRTGSILMLS